MEQPKGKVLLLCLFISTACTSQKQVLLGKPTPQGTRFEIRVLKENYSVISATVPDSEIWGQRNPTGLL